MAVPMACKVCGEQTFITVKIKGIFVPLCKGHDIEHSMNETAKFLDKLIADMKAGKPPKCSPKMMKLAKDKIGRDKVYEELEKLYKGKK